MNKHYVSQTIVKSRLRTGSSVGYCTQAVILWAGNWPSNFCIPSYVCFNTSLKIIINSIFIQSYEIQLEAFLQDLPNAMLVIFLAQNCLSNLCIIFNVHIIELLSNFYQCSINSFSGDWNYSWINYSRYLVVLFGENLLRKYWTTNKWKLVKMCLLT